MSKMAPAVFHKICLAICIIGFSYLICFRETLCPIPQYVQFAETIPISSRLADGGTQAPGTCRSLSKKSFVKNIMPTFLLAATGGPVAGGGAHLREAGTGAR